MARIVVTHDVADVDKWLGFKAERAGAIATLGGSDVADHVAHDGSASVAVSVDVADVDGMIAVLMSPPPEVLAIMQSHGVVPPLKIYIER